MYTLRNPKGESTETFTRKGSLRRVIPPEPNKDNLFGRQNEDLNKIYRLYRQEYIILAEYKMIQSEDIRGVYVIPSRQNPLVWFGVIFVRNGPYEDAVFRFTINLDEHFPDSSHPKVTFQSEIFHPVIHADTKELNLLQAFPTWNKNEQHIWQVLKYIQWMFENIGGCVQHAVNKEAAEMFQSSKDHFVEKAQHCSRISRDHLFDEPPTDDKHYITFEEYNPDVHKKVRSSMISLAEDNKIEKSGYSWVFPQSFKPLERPPSPRSETDL